MTSPLTSSLMRWYRANKRDLPWRRDQDPYRVWLSEVILQQTRVVQGTLYFERFTTLFPDVHALAAAPEQEVMKAWQGLGYYSRARNLMATARQISGMGGRFPATAEELGKLRGIGPYTAAAIASICFGERVPVLDGNVMRVLARYFGIGDAIDLPATRKTMTGLLNELIPARQPGDFNQAMMEFGALVCTPRSPLCAVCPVAESCHARTHDLVAELPVKRGKKAPTEVFLFYFVHRTSAGIALRRRPPTGIWHNLYEFPSLETEQNIPPDQALKQAGFPTGTPLLKVTGPMKHILSHRIIHCLVLEVGGKALPGQLSEGASRYRKSAVRELPVSRLMEKILDTLDLH